MPHTVLVLLGKGIDIIGTSELTLLLLLELTVTVNSEEHMFFKS
jgi:hypothetical protein